MLNRVMARISPSLLQYPATYRIRIAIVLVLSTPGGSLLRRLLIHHPAKSALIHRLNEFRLHRHLRIG